MSADELKAFWHDFCQRQEIEEEIRNAGDELIAEDPEFWSDRSLWQLHDVIKAERKS